MTIPALNHELAAGYDLVHAYWLCKAAHLAYQDESEIREEVVKWGFDRFQFLYSKHQLPFLIEDTQAYLVASEKMVIVAFRGTEPKQICDWLTDGNAPASPGPALKGLVHLGFNQALASVFPAILDGVGEYRTNNQTLWFTGHSLGGALAMLAAAWMYFEDPELLADGVYTFGQPRTCDRLLASAYDAAFKSRVFRFVNNNDIVPQVPPEPLYHHVGKMMYFDANGMLHDRMSTWGGLTDRFEGFTADMFAPGTDGVRDHMTYLGIMEKNLR